MKHTSLPQLLLLGAVALGLCLGSIAASVPIRRATCVLEGIGASSGVVTGHALFFQDGGNSTTIRVCVHGLAPNTSYGIHMGPFGDVSDTFAGRFSGSHFVGGADSDQALHGRPSDSNPRPHNGDLGNIVTDATGDFIGLSEGSPSPYLTLNGTVDSIIGRAFVLNADPDTFDRTGRSSNGPRLAQCVVGLTNTETGIVAPSPPAENDAAPTPQPTGSYASCKLLPFADTATVPNPAVSNSVPNGTLQLWTDDRSRFHFDVRILGLAADQEYHLMTHKYGDLSSVAALGPMLNPSLPFYSFTSNCRGANVNSTSVCARTFPLNRLLGRSLALHTTDPATGEDRILAACVLGQMNPRTTIAYSPLTPANLPPRAHCRLIPTTTANSLGYPIAGVVYLNATDEFDCSSSVSVSISGLKTEPGAKHGFHIHTYGDVLEPDGVRLSGHYNPFNMPHGRFPNTERHIGDLVNLEPVGGVVEGVVIASNPDVHLTGRTSTLGRAMVIHRDVDDGASQPGGGSGPRLAMCVIGRSDYISESEAATRVPNSLICQSDPSLNQGIAVFYPTPASPSVSGHVYFVHNVTAARMFAVVSVQGAPNTPYQLRVYTHGAQNPDAANIAGDANVLRVIAEPPTQTGALEQSIFTSNNDGVLQVTMGPLRHSPDNPNAPTVALRDWLGRMIAIHPIVNGMVYPATGYAVLGMTNTPPPDFVPGSVSSQSSSSSSGSSSDSSSSDFFSTSFGIVVLGFVVVGIGAVSFNIIKRRRDSPPPYPSAFHSSPDGARYGTFVEGQLPL